MAEGPITLGGEGELGASVRPPASISGGWWDNAWPRRPVPSWKDRALPIELGSRAYADLIQEARRMWPPGLIDLEEIRGE